MRRKLVKQGNNALTLTVPHLWAEKFNLKAGSEVSIEEKGRGLYIDITDVQGDKKEITVPSIEKFMRRLIHVWYTQGYDELKVNFNDIETINLIREIMSELLGFEIVEQGSNYCIIHYIAKESEADFDPTLRKVFQMITMMGEECIQKIQQRDYSYLLQIANQDTMINKLTFYCERLLAKYGYPQDFRRTNLIFTFVWTLEQIADEYRDICREIAAQKLPLDKVSLQKLKEIHDLFSLLYQAFYQPSIEDTITLRNRSKIIYDDLFSAFERKKAEHLLLHHLLRICDKINSLTYCIVS